jgi:hypothetical protein
VVKSEHERSLSGITGELTMAVPLQPISVSLGASGWEKSGAPKMQRGEGAQSAQQTYMKGVQLNYFTNTSQQIDATVVKRTIAQNHANKNLLNPHHGSFFLLCI